MAEAGWTGVTLARVLRPRGRHGEVAAEILTDFPQRLTTLREAYLWDGRQPRRVAIHSCWLHKGQAIFHFEGSDSISDAERFVGLEVQVPLAERVALPTGRYYITDLTGCEVFDVETKEAKEAEKKPCMSFASCASSASSASFLGTVRDVQPTGEKTPGAFLLVVETSRGELLIPFAEEICRRIDIAARRIEVVLPEGLRELNRS